MKEQEDRRKRKAKKKMNNQAPPSFARKTSFLLEIEAYNVAKLEHSWKQGIGCKTTEELVKTDVGKDTKQTGVKKSGKAKESSNKTKNFGKASTKIDKETKQQTKEINKQSKQDFN